MIEAEKANFSVTTMCRVLQVSTSGYYAWRVRLASARSLEDEFLLERILSIHESSRQTYGAPRIQAELRSMGIRCSKRRVARLMREAGIEGISRRRKSGTTKADASRTPAPDLVDREFVAAAPNRLWVADIKQAHTDEGWLYLAAVTDVFSRRVVGWAMGDRMTADLAVEAVNMAVWNRRPQVGVIHHSDHGSQYTALIFGKTLREAGIRPSMGSVGDAYDNAMAESFFATLETELLNRHKWPTRRVLATAIFEYIEGFYNRRRRHSALDYLSPADFETQWFRSKQEENQASAA